MTSKFMKTIELEDFLEENRLAVADFTCQLCFGVPNNPVIYHREEMIYCENCLKQAMSENIIHEASYSPVRFISDIIAQKVVYCKNKFKNCFWTGKFAILSEHLSECPKHPVRCTFDGCSESTNRENLQEHELQCEYRIICCDECSIEISKINLENHLTECPEFKILCSQDCGQSIKRKEMNQHIAKECDNCLIECDYKMIGCTSNIFKKNAFLHREENRSYHDLLIANQINQIYINQVEMSKMIKELTINQAEIANKLQKTHNLIQEQTKKRKESEKEIKEMIFNERKELKTLISLKMENPIPSTISKNKSKLLFLT